MKANYDKCHLLMSMITPICIKAKDSAIRESDNGKLLGVAMETNLSFDLRLKNILASSHFSENYALYEYP